MSYEYCPVKDYNWILSMGLVHYAQLYRHICSWIKRTRDLREVFTFTKSSSGTEGLKCQPWVAEDLSSLHFLWSLYTCSYLMKAYMPQSNHNNFKREFSLLQFSSLHKLNSEVVQTCCTSHGQTVCLSSPEDKHVFDLNL